MPIYQNSDIQVFVLSSGKRQVKYTYNNVNVSPIKGDLNTFLNECKEHALRDQALDRLK